MNGVPAPAPQRAEREGGLVNSSDPGARTPREPVACRCQVSSSGGPVMSLCGQCCLWHMVPRQLCSMTQTLGKAQPDTSGSGTRPDGGKAKDKAGVRWGSHVEGFSVALPPPANWGRGSEWNYSTRSFSPKAKCYLLASACLTIACSWPRVANIWGLGPGLDCLRAVTPGHRGRETGSSHKAVKCSTPGPPTGWFGSVSEPRAAES